MSQTHRRRARRRASSAQPLTIEIIRTTGADSRSNLLRETMDSETFGLYAESLAAMEPDERASTLAALATNPEELIEVVIAVDEGGVDVGHAALRKLSDGYEVKKVFVVPGARGRGISRQLMAAIEDVARELGEARIRLQTGPLQVEAIALYRAIGYVPIPAFGPYVVLGPDIVYFAKDL
jgi:GNAT superfamily N-acetyltransferase